MTVDYVVVGSGLTGATIARCLADAGQEVVVVERRSHIGGNVHSYAHESGILIHTYGPHYFRTSSDRIWEFAQRFASFYRFEATIRTYVDGVYENWPIAGSYVRRAFPCGYSLEFTGKPSNFEEACLSMMPRPIYEKFVKGYTEKQWGVTAGSLSAQLATRFDVREDDEPRLSRHPYQGLPLGGYAEWMSNMMRGIPVVLNLDYLRNRDLIRPRKHLVFTGPIDEFFDFRLGRLNYRGQKRIHNYYVDAVTCTLPTPQVNNPDPANGPHIRTLDWKQMMPIEYGGKIQGSVLTEEIPETPSDPDRYEYPFPDSVNAELYAEYRRKASSIENCLICGRLGEYRYYDMDQAIGRAMTLAERLIRGNS